MMWQESQKPRGADRKCKGNESVCGSFCQGLCGIQRRQSDPWCDSESDFPMMYPRLKQIIEETLPVKVYGYVPVVKDCVLESRHLGLVMPEEIADLND